MPTPGHARTWGVSVGTYVATSDRRACLRRVSAMKNSKQCVPVIGQNTKNYQEYTHGDKHEGEVEGLGLLVPGGPADSPVARESEEASAGIPFNSRRPTVSNKETHDEQDRADAVEPDRDRAADAGAEQEAEQERDERRAARDDDEQEHEPAQRSADESRARRLARHAPMKRRRPPAGRSTAARAPRAFRPPRAARGRAGHDRRPRGCFPKPHA